MLQSTASYQDSSNFIAAADVDEFQEANERLENDFMKLENAVTIKIAYPKI